jgi:hypothetical protein
MGLNKNSVESLYIHLVFMPLDARNVLVNAPLYEHTGDDAGHEFAGPFAEKSSEMTLSV